MPSILGNVVSLAAIGERITERRKDLGLNQATLARSANVGRTTLEALENGRLGELGYSKLTKILAVLGLELQLHEASLRRPTLEDLMEEDRNDKGLDRRR